ncbi:sensor histidine kinase [Paenibacillus nanensis]|uniref:histidine kinase n=1 Tax=Paenibacillus nanensis TaxID=393251 RepID=A0A3A1VIN2_9BACL|nr:sensor histidine kinase [Paenibacillus nanensis]RIX59476.1 sensor histidine kinase [Paenibacillus nanensis]
MPMREKCQREKEKRWQYLLLANMAIPVYFMLQEPAVRMVPGLGALVLMLGLQIAAISRRSWVPYLVLIQTAVMLYLALVYNPMYLYIVFFMSYSFYVLRFPLLVGVTAAFALIVIGSMIAGGYESSMQYWFNMLPPIFGGCVLPYIVRVSARYRDMATRLQAATKQIERMAQQEERQRIAGDLHDTLGHTLSLIKLKSELMEKLVHRSPDKAAAEARDMHLAAAAALKQMRETVSDMKIVRLAEEWEHARMLGAAANIRIHIIDGAENFPFTPLQESVLAMCVREAVTNMVRHSRATECRIEVRVEDEAIKCVVADNGIGLSSEAAAASSNGIAGMKQRLALLEGQLLIDSTSKGTRLTMYIPIVKRLTQKGAADL